MGHPIRDMNIAITAASGAYAGSIGEFCIGIMFALARKVPLAVRTQDCRAWPENTRGVFTGMELRGKTLEIISYGSIGREAARIAMPGFQMLYRVVAVWCRPYLFQSFSATRRSMSQSRRCRPAKGSIFHGNQKVQCSEKSAWKQ